jgi:hypothetical protein
VARVGHPGGQLRARPDFQLVRLHLEPSGQKQLSASLRLRRKQEVPGFVDSHRSELILWVAGESGSPGAALVVFTDPFRGSRDPVRRRHAIALAVCAVDRLLLPATG